MVVTIINTVMFDKEFAVIKIYLIYELILRRLKAFVYKSNL